MICLHCGNELPKGRTKYCNKKCQNANREYVGHDYKLKSTSDDCICPKCRKPHKKRNAEKWCYCQKCKENIMKYGITDTKSDECMILV